MIYHSEIYFTENIRTLRKYKGYTQAKIAKMLNTHRATYDAWENKGIEPNLEKVMKLSSIYSIGVQYIIGTKLTNEKINYLLKTLGQ